MGEVGKDILTDCNEGDPALRDELSTAYVACLDTTNEIY